jgi:hypothetical protein
MVPLSDTAANVTSRWGENAGGLIASPTPPCLLPHTGSAAPYPLSTKKGAGFHGRGRLPCCDNARRAFCGFAAAIPFPGLPRARPSWVRVHAPGPTEWAAVGSNRLPQGACPLAFPCALPHRTVTTRAGDGGRRARTAVTWAAGWGRCRDSGGGGKWGISSTPLLLQPAETPKSI